MTEEDYSYFGQSPTDTIYQNQLINKKLCQKYVWKQCHHSIVCPPESSDKSIYNWELPSTSLGAV